MVERDQLRKHMTFILNASNINNFFKIQAKNVSKVNFQDGQGGSLGKIFKNFYFTNRFLSILMRDFSVFKKFFKNLFQVDLKGYTLIFHVILKIKNSSKLKIYYLICLKLFLVDIFQTIAHICPQCTW